MTEDSAHAWYKGGGPLHPWKGETDPEPTEWDEEKKYSWVKAPRYDGQPAQVGPLADALVGYAQARRLRAGTSAHEEVDRCHARQDLRDRSRQSHPAMLHSTLARHDARAIRAAVLSELAMKQWQLLTDNILKGDTTIYNKPEFPKGTIEGVGFHEAPRGVLSHWVVIEDGTIQNHQAVVPTMWNASLRYTSGTLDPMLVIYGGPLLQNPSPAPSTPSKSCARFTPSILAWPAQSTPSTPPAGTLPK